MAINSAIGSIGRPSPKVAKTTKLPAPVGGVDARTILAGGDPAFCIYSFNLLPHEYGLKVRNGYREWTIDIPNDFGVTTIIPFGGTDDDSSNDRLYAVTNLGIYDITVAEAVPVLKIDFSLPANGGDTSDNAGRGVYSFFTNDAGTEYLFYADSANGLFQYDELTDAWAAATAITGPTIGNINFVMTHKDQLWVIERDTTSAWYLSSGAVAGAAVEYNFGGKFKHGANLAGLFNWTIDGGAGVDDYLVAVSRAGDVMPYQGTDPSDAEKWSLVGQWFIGTIPKGSRFGSQEGGNLNLLSIYGLTAMDELIVGVDGKNARAQSEAGKVAIILRNAMERYINNDGWQVNYIPAQGTLLINSPQKGDGQYIQYARSTTVQGWGFWREVPMLSFDEWDGKVYFGTDDGRVMVMDTFIDGVQITPPAEGPNGVPVNFSILSTFQDLGEPALFKRGKYCRPQFISLDIPSATCTFRYDYNLSETVNNRTLQSGTVGIWDIGVWDANLWGSETPTGFNEPQGGSGYGRTVAIAMAGKTRAETSFISWDVTWDTGGPM